MKVVVRGPRIVGAWPTSAVADIMKAGIGYVVFLSADCFSEMASPHLHSVSSIQEDFAKHSAEFIDLSLSTSEKKVGISPRNMISKCGSHYTDRQTATKRSAM